MAKQQWYYQRAVAIGDPETVGPITSQQLKAAIENDTLRPKDMVMSEATRQQWVKAGDVPSIAKLFASVDQARKKQRESERAQRAADQERMRSQQYHDRVVKTNQRAEVAHQKNIATIYSFASDMREPGNSAGWACEIFALLGILAGIGIMALAPSVMQEILGVLVFGFSVLLAAIGVGLMHLATIANKISAIYIAQKMDQDPTINNT